jgi:hypothetical protein
MYEPSHSLHLACHSRLHPLAREQPNFLTPG